MQAACRSLAALALCLFGGASAAQSVFSNATTILLPLSGTGSASEAVPGSPAGPFPSQIVVSGMGTSISKLTVTIRDFRHVGPDDIDMLLVGPGGQKMLIWSDAGGLNSTCGANLDNFACNNGDFVGTGIPANPGSPGPTITLDDAATGSLPDSALLTSGTFKPTNYGSTGDLFPSPAPAQPYLSPAPAGTATFASVFNTTNPNGTWSLYVADDGTAFTGRIFSGWSLTITASGSTLEGEVKEKQKS